jgi:hypothetical protein
LCADAGCCRCFRGLPFTVCCCYCCCNHPI